MALTLTVTDSENGTGGVAHVGGVSGSTSVAVYVGRVSGELGTIPFASGGVRAGNGNVTLSLSRGYYFAYAEDVSLNRSPLTYFAATDGLDAVATRIRNSAIASIKLLPYFGENVYAQMFPDESNVKLPGVLVTVEGTMETDEMMMSTVDDVGRPIKITIADRQDRYDHGKLPNYELWRQSIIRIFINQQLAGVPESVRCKIEPDVIVDPSAPQYQYIVSAFVVRAVCREPRGLGA